MTRSLPRFSTFAAILALLASGLATGPRPALALDPDSLRVRRLAGADVELTWTDPTPSQYCIYRDLAAPPPLALSGSTTFLVWVDAPGPAPLWFFDVEESAACAANCGPAGDLVCGTRAFAGDTRGGGSTDVVDVWGACGVNDATGPEQVWRFVAPADVQVQVDLTDLAAGLDLVVLADLGAGCDPLQCVATGDTQVTFAATAGSTWYVVVDGRLDAAGPYLLDITCSGTDCTAGGSLACGDSIIGDTSLPGAEALIDDWSPCSAAGTFGPELAWSFVATADATVTATLSGLVADLDVFVLADAGSGCDARECRAFGDDQVQFDVVAGDAYHVVVDGVDPGGGPFVLDLACAPVGPQECAPLGQLSCGVATSGRTDDAGTTDVLEVWPCRAGDFTGPEAAFDLTVPLSGLVRATLTAGGGALDVFVVPAGVPCTAAACVAVGDTEATWMAAAGSTWRVIVDGPLPAAFTLVVTCPPPPVQVCIPTASIGCGATRPGSTNDPGATNVIDSYGCAGVALAGPEFTYTFDASGTGPVTFAVTPEPGVDLDIIVLAAPTSACDPAACLAHGDVSVVVDVQVGQRYFVLVDGPGAAGADYVLTTSCGFPQGPCNAAFDLTCGGVISTSTGGASATDGNDAYPCGGGDVTGPEVTFAFVPSDASRGGDVRVVLDQLTQDLDVFVLENRGTGCDPSTCIAHGDNEVTFRREAGRSYFIVVDGPVAGDFRIFVASCLNDPAACDPQESLLCGTFLPGQGNALPGSTDGIDTYTTCPGLGVPPDESGPEYTYTYTSTTDRTVTVSLANVTPAPLHVFALEDVGGGCDPTQCRAFGVNGVTFFAAAGTTHHVVIEGFRGAASTYDLAVACLP